MDLEQKCLDIVDRLEELNHALGKYNQALRDSDFGLAKEIKKHEISQLYEPLAESVFDDADYFFRLIKQPELWLQIEEVVDLSIGSGSRTFPFESIADILAENCTWKTKGLLDTQNYQKFAHLLLSNQEILARFRSMIDKYQYSETQREEVLKRCIPFINEFFVNFALSEFNENDQRDSVIRVQEIPDEITRQGFGSSFSCGIFWADSLGESAGIKMEGATIVADRVGDWFCSKMRFGTAAVMECAGKGLLHGAEGGTAYIGMSDGGIYKMRENRYHLLLGDYQISIYGVHPHGVYRYNDKMENYENLHGEKREFVIGNQELWSAFITSGYQENVGVIRDLGSVATNPTQGMLDGFLVLRDISDSDIGKGMEGGIVILEKEGMTLEEARTKICRHRRGGLIMLRVPDQEKPEKTKLVIVG